MNRPRATQIAPTEPTDNNQHHYGKQPVSALRPGLRYSCIRVLLAGQNARSRLGVWDRGAVIEWIGRCHSSESRHTAAGRAVGPRNHTHVPGIAVAGGTGRPLASSISGSVRLTILRCETPIWKARI